MQATLPVTGHFRLTQSWAKIGSLTKELETSHPVISDRRTTIAINGYSRLKRQHALEYAASRHESWHISYFSVSMCRFRCNPSLDSACLFS